MFVAKGKEVNEFREMVIELLIAAGHFNISDFIPWLAWMDLQGLERGVRKLHTKWDKLLDHVLEYHLKSTHVHPDLLDSLLAYQDVVDEDEENR